MLVICHASYLLLVKQSMCSCFACYRKCSGHLNKLFPVFGLNVSVIRELFFCDENHNYMRWFIFNLERFSASIVITSTTSFSTSATSFSIRQCLAKVTGGELFYFSWCSLQISKFHTSRVFCLSGVSPASAYKASAVTWFYYAVTYGKFVLH